MDITQPEWITLTSGPLAIQVTTDYIKRADGVRMPVTPSQAQAWADSFDAMLPTPKIVRLIESRAVPLVMHGLFEEVHPNESMGSERLIKRHNDLIERDVLEIKGKGNPPNPVLWAGHKKDIVIGRTRITHPNKVTIYGGMKADGSRVQGLMPGSKMAPKYGHSLDYFDYSHGVRLVKKTALLGGSPVELAKVLGDDRDSAMLSDQGALRGGALRY